MDESAELKHAGQSLGSFLKKSRQAVGLTLRAVEAKTTVTNGYLSQIESGQIQRPSPNTLFDLAAVYGLDYGELLDRAGHRVPEARPRGSRAALSGIPKHALEDLDASEQSQLVDYIAYLKSKRTT